MRSRWLLSAVVCSGLACGPQVGDDTGGAAESSGGTGGSSGTATQGMTSSAGTTGADDTTAASITVGSSVSASTAGCVDDGSDGGVKLDVGPPEPECDIFAQDCEAGFKCVPDNFWTRVCVPLVDEPIADGESCTPGNVSDPCGPGSWCGLVDYGTVDEPGTGMGTCLPLCQGSAVDPQCPDGTICVIDDESVVAFCQAPCDPFAADPCGANISCQPTAQGFGCLPSGMQQAGDGCQQQDSCADGLFCIPAGALQDCCSFTCCAPVCDDAHPCAVGQCIRVEPALPGGEGIGFCGA